MELKTKQAALPMPVVVGSEIERVEIKNLPEEENDYLQRVKGSPQREKVWLSVGGATSFEEAEQALQANQLSDDIIDLTFAFDNIAWNIGKIPLADPTDKTIKGKMILAEAKGLVDRIEGLIDTAEDSLDGSETAKDNNDPLTTPDDTVVPEGGEPIVENALKTEEDESVVIDAKSFTGRVKSVLTKMGIWKPVVKMLKEGSSFKLFKNGDEFFFYGRATNNALDKENDILTDEAHKEFSVFLDENPDQMPVLQTWHTAGTERKSRASWHEYADGFFHYIVPLTEEEAKGIEAFAEEFTPGMSHGFWPLGLAPGVKVLERKGNLITKYRTEEISILPLQYAANEYTTFSLVS